ncbi:MAG: hypothetical protein N2035_09950, partial [Chthoniobacterales bacterium]|nr:hypothetical protein [Chthoniobacterales bacterium]
TAITLTMKFQNGPLIMGTASVLEICTPVLDKARPCSLCDPVQLHVFPNFKLAKSAEFFTKPLAGSLLALSRVSLGMAWSNPFLLRARGKPRRRELITLPIRESLCTFAGRERASYQANLTKLSLDKRCVVA